MLNNKIIYNYFSQRDLLCEIEFLNEFYQQNPDFYNYTICEITKLNNGSDHIEIGKNKQNKYINSNDHLDSYFRRAVHLIAEAYGYMSKTCSNCPNTFEHSSYFHRKTIRISRNENLSKKNRSSKHKLYEHRRKYVNIINKSANNLRPII